MTEEKNNKEKQNRRATTGNAAAPGSASVKNTSNTGGAAKPHKRRKRYSGRYPKNFHEKYKELNPEKYGSIAGHVIAKGNTPAGTHIPIMVEEILDFLQIKPGQKGFDATLGYGGHSKAMLEKLDHTGHLCATDVDPIESAKTKKRLEEAGFGEDCITIRNTNFANIDKLAEEFGPFDFLLADLGISSMQLDNPDRGFSYKVDGPLDLRMNPEKGAPASELLQRLSREELIGIFLENSDEPYAEEIATTLVKDLRKGVPILTTNALYEEIQKALEFLPAGEQRDAVKKSSARVFQALRIEVNQELEVLYTFLEKLPYVMAPNGRVAVLTFHSGEDRLVKKAFKAYQKLGLFSDVARNVIRPSAEECVRNPRSKPTKLRWAIRSEE